MKKIGILLFLMLALFILFFSGCIQMKDGEKCTGTTIVTLGDDISACVEGKWVKKCEEGQTYSTNKTKLACEEGKWIKAEKTVTEKEEETVEEVSSEPAKEESSEMKLSNCDAFPDKLDLCEPFSCEFKHPLTGEMMEKKIIGIIDNKCQYAEEMPNNGKMDCKYSESLRKAVAQYYKDIAVAESTGVSATIDTGSGETKATYTIDGKEVENPLQEAMNTNVCVISGYA